MENIAKLLKSLGLILKGLCIKAVSEVPGGCVFSIQVGLEEPQNLHFTSFMMMPLVLESQVDTHSAFFRPFSQFACIILAPTLFAFSGSHESSVDIE